jgi:hypothetical protein
MTSKATPKIPAWLRRHLAQTGTMIDGVTRSARIQTCKTCHRTVIRGFTDEPCSILAAADLTPLSNLGEAVALMQGRMTFDLTYRGGRLEIDLREADHIQGSPPETPGWWRAKSDVAEHRSPIESPLQQQRPAHRPDVIAPSGPRKRQPPRSSATKDPLNGH